ncbi:host specificity factor TipJ family phage tail protein [Coralloluteibacterium thermophilus]|uniref:Host specificity factor TipJ family phage tail protein n=1 Tax=Coralloluteibacterium thermophilum TaxID=2707049 RepID=A0ABV9NLS6_9GAMM
MGVMEDMGRLIVTPHPATLEGQTNQPADLQPGETLYAFLRRNVPDFEDNTWEVCIGGRKIPPELWMHVRPKHGQMIEVRGDLGRQALYLVAMVALTYFTFGIGTGAMAAGGGAWGAGVVSVYGGTLGAAAAFVAGSVLINKALGPKLESPGGQERDSVYSISGSRNQARPYEPVPLLFGSVRIAPDLASAPYTWYEGDDQILGMVLNAGINVHNIEAVYNGDALLSSFEGTQVYVNGFSGMPDQPIPLYSNADTIDGGELERLQWVQRTTSPDTVRIQINIEYILADTTSKGKPHTSRERVVAEYRPVGTTAWLPLATVQYANNKHETKRATIARDVARGQYDVRVRRLGEAFEPVTGNDNGFAQFQWTTLTSVQADEADYAGLARIGVQIKATGQLTGAPDELRVVAHARPTPVWNGSQWVTEQTSNPGAQILQYARGIHDQNGKRIAGLGLSDEQIDIPALQAFMLHCAANGYRYDFYVRGARSHQEMLDSIALAGLGQITWAGGRLSVTWAADGQPLGGVVNMATIKRGSFQVDYTLANAADGIEYTYVDRTDWTTKTIRVPAPGVTTMLNPAQLSGEGITSEEHAAKLARYHLAQSLYQYKDITFSTDLEHLSYRRLSILALQHDLTQWGYGGRLVSATMGAGRLVTLTLDEPVPAPASGNAFIGLRIPGEEVYRVFQVQTFAGESREIRLLEAWPEDAAVPGNDDENPAHDTIWIYDFKQTPGYRVRVVAIEPESDLKGASVAVVPEPPEFWHYVNTGEYIPPANQSLLSTRPVASNARVDEVQTIQGDTVFTELVVTFDLKGHAAHTAIFAAHDGGEMVRVADTLGQSARFRISAAGTYTIVVRPYSVDGVAGGVATVIYSTVATEIPPVGFDHFSVDEVPGGLRRYTWGYAPTSIEPADLAGAEIRYLPGTLMAPVWDQMIAIGEGFHTAAFEAAVPPAGEWTFAIRARNTSGLLSHEILVLHRTLSLNLGEQIEVIGDGIEQVIVDTEQLRNEMLADFADMQDRVDEVRAYAEAEVAALLANAAALRDDIDQVIADVSEWDADIDGIQLQLTQVQTKADGAVSDLALLGARNATGTAYVLNGDTVQVAQGETLAQWRNSVQAAQGALGARIDGETSARVAGDEANATAITALQVELADKATVQQVSEAVNRIIQTEQGLEAEGARIDLVVAQLSEQAFRAEVTWEMRAAWLTWSAANASVAMFPDSDQSSRGAAAITTTATDPQFLSPAFSVPGARNRRVRAKVRLRNFAGSTWEGTLYFATATAGIGASGQTAITPRPTGNGWSIVEWDMSGNTAWREGTITRIRLDFAGAGIGGIVDVMWVAIGDADTDSPPASAYALSITEAGVRQAANELVAQSQRIDASESRIVAVETAQVATASDLQSTRQTVTQQGNQITAESVRLDGVVAKTGELDFVADWRWSFVGANTSPPWAIAGGRFEQFPAASNFGAIVIVSTSNDPQFISPDGLRINGNQSYMVRALVRRRTAGLWDGRLFWQNEDGGFSAARSAVTPTPGNNGSWVLLEWDLSADAAWRGKTISRLRVDFEASSPATTDVQWIAVGAPGVPSGYASGVSEMGVRVVEAEGRLQSAEARYTFALNAGGDTVGMQAIAGGSISLIRFLSEHVHFVSSDGSFSLQNGVAIWRAGNYMKVIGPNGFGQNSEMVVWYGPYQSNLANCRRSNAISYETRNGLAYWGGQIFAGTLSTSRQNRDLGASTEVSVSTGTNGGPIAVNFSYQYQENRVGRINATFSAGAGSNSARVRLFRRIGAGAEVQVASFMATGILYIDNSSSSPDGGRPVANTSIDGSQTWIDNDGGTGNRTYRVVMDQRQIQAVNQSGGSGTEPANSLYQNLGITTSEG